jgi:predicted nucleotidyltransferase
MIEIKKKLILKTVVGSRAHGLANENSDIDYRGVFLVPTRELLKLNAPKDFTSWIENREDDISYELGKFLFLATKCNPTILEVFKAPVVESSDIGESLRKQFQRVWNSIDVRNAFIGYGLNQRKKFLEEKDKRPHKFAVAYLRTLVQAYYLLTFEELIIDMSNTEEFETLKRFKNGQYEVSEVIQKCWEWENKVKESYNHNSDKKTDLDQINSWLIKVRRSHWD